MDSGQAREQQAVAEVVLDRHEEAADHASMYAQQSAHRREHERPADVVDQAAAAEHADAHDVLVVVEEHEHLGMNGGAVACGHGGGQHAV